MKYLNSEKKLLSYQITLLIILSSYFMLLDYLKQQIVILLEM